MDNYSLMDKRDLENNPSARVPVCLCLDVSYSMGQIIANEGRRTGETIFRDGEEWGIVEGGTTLMDRLKEGLEKFYSAIFSDRITKYSADIAIITFGDNPDVVQEFQTLEEGQVVPELKLSGDTAMGAALNMALDMLEQRKEKYRTVGVDYWQPWLIIMTDGKPQDPNDPEGIELKRAARRATEMVKNKKLTVFPIGVNEKADRFALESVSPVFKPLKLINANFSEFFVWLAKSVEQTANSSIGESIKLDVEGIKSWGTPL